MSTRSGRWLIRKWAATDAAAHDVEKLDKLAYKPLKRKRCYDATFQLMTKAVSLIS